VELGRYEALFCHKLLHFNTVNVCYVCDLYFSGADELRIHVATHHRDIAGLHPKVMDGWMHAALLMRFSDFLCRCRTAFTRPPGLVNDNETEMID